MWGDWVDSNRIFIGQKRIIRLIFDTNSKDKWRIFYKKYYSHFSLISNFTLFLYIKQNINKFSQNSSRRSTRVFKTFENSPDFSCKRLFNRFTFKLCQFLNCINFIAIVFLFQCRLLNNYTFGCWDLPYTYLHNFNFYYRDELAKRLTIARGSFFQEYCVSLSTLVNNNADSLFTFL